MHHSQPKPILRRKRKVLSGLEGLLEIVGFLVMAEGVRAGTHSEGWRERVPDCWSCNAESTGAKSLPNYDHKCSPELHGTHESVGLTSSVHVLGRAMGSAAAKRLAASSVTIVFLSI